MTDSFAVPAVKPVPNLIPADACAPAHERLQKPLGFRIHRNIRKLVPEFLQNLIAVKQCFNFSKSVIDDRIFAVIDAVFLMQNVEVAKCLVFYITVHSCPPDFSL
jgi:hypothetical protein